MAARGEGGTISYQDQFYVYHSSSSRVILKDFSSVNTCY